MRRVSAPILLAVALLLTACSREQVTQTTERVTDVTSNAVKTVSNRIENSVPISGNRITREQMEQERYNSEWRKLQSFRAASARKSAAQTVPAAAPAAPVAPINFATDPKVTESFKAGDPSTYESMPVRVPITGKMEGPSVLKAQVLLDRAGFSVGALDGRWGKNSEIAVYWFQRERNLEPTGGIDQRTYEMLSAAAGGGPTMTRYAITADDVDGPFTKLPEDVYEKEKLDCLCYESLSEALAEKFHSAAELLPLLNPGVNLDTLTAGQEITVPNVRPWSPGPTGPDVMRIVVSVKGSYLHALDANGNLLFHAPTTLGSKYDPSPNEAVKLGNIAYKPTFHYQPKLFADVPDDKPEANLKQGPNSPVGVVWMALSKPHFGIHGTNDPDSIGYASSHGCVRLANWDANDLAHRSKQGIPVEFVDTKKDS
ncbi:MAG TPA: L,D-transpeptidase [Thermoanaerobaculia bacterium]|nr:L,D-transpeptidase [Thermoanaerobaculia bacterium]